MKMGLSKDNHLKFSPLNGAAVRGFPGRPVMEFRDECILAAREIAARFPSQKLTVLMSGGVDSEVCAEAFRLARIPFSATIVRLESDLNIHDICWAVDYCEEKNIPYSFYDFKMRDYFKRSKNSYSVLAPGNLFPSYHMLSKVVSDLNKSGSLIPIIGGGEPEFSWYKAKLFYYEYQSDFSVLKYMEENSLTGVPLFFEWSPELHWSFIFSREIQSFVCTGPANCVTSEPVKFDMYHRQFGVRKRTKYNGFEKAVAYFPELVRDVTKELEREVNATEYFSLLKSMNAGLLASSKARPKQASASFT